MEKVNMLPRLPGIKTAVFTRRIVLYHETFAPCTIEGSCKKWKEDKKVMRCKLKPLGMIWHEGIQGQNDEDVTSTVIKFLHHSQYRDASVIVTWADNCVGQLKNWTLYAALILEVNRHPNIQKISIKYFEEGHTFVSADSLHAQVEKDMRMRKRLYDFNDFEGCVSKSGVAVEMKAEDFFNFRNHLSTGKDTNYPYLADVSEFQVRKGSTKMYRKNSHSDTEYKSGEFVTKKFIAKVSSDWYELQKEGPRGFITFKVEEIIEKIGAVIPKKRMKFWLQLPKNGLLKDLTSNYDHLEKHGKKRRSENLDESMQRKSQ